MTITEIKKRSRERAANAFKLYKERNAARLAQDMGMRNTSPGEHLNYNYLKPRQWAQWPW